MVVLNSVLTWIPSKTTTCRFVFLHVCTQVCAHAQLSHLYHWFTELQSVFLDFQGGFHNKKCSLQRYSRLFEFSYNKDIGFVKNLLSEFTFKALQSAAIVNMLWCCSILVIPQNPDFLPTIKSSILPKSLHGNAMGLFWLVKYPTEISSC